MLEFPSLRGDSNFYSVSGGKDPERDNLYSKVLQNGILFFKKITIQTPTFHFIL